MSTTPEQTGPAHDAAPARLPEAGSNLCARLAAREATAAVVGLGYVGLPLVRAVHGAGFRVIGFDIDEKKIEMLGAGRGYLRHLGENLARDLAASDRFEPTSDPARLAGADVIVLCVPTPLGPHREPDLGFVRSSAEMAASVARPGTLVVLESTTYPGTTREEVAPVFERAGHRVGESVFIAYSPEREDPGRAGVTTADIPKLVGGLDGASTRVAAAFYGAFVSSVHEVASAEVAEAAKLLENVYRAVNIALVNELKMILDRMGIDIWQVIEAASTKPFGFQPFYPGPGLGGHCIPIDPFYLAWRARETGHATRFIELAGEINHAMPGYVVDRVAEALNERGRALKGSTVLVVGIAYKPNVDDIREAPAAEIIERLTARGATVRYHDPHVPTFPSMRRYDIRLDSVELTPGELRAADCVLIVTNHDAIDYALIGREAGIIVDTRNAMAGVPGVRAEVRKA